MITTIIRTAVLYFFVIVGIRLMGKRQIGDMQPSELVITLLISEIAAIPLQDVDQPVMNGVVAIFMLVILEIIISVLAMKSFFIRKLISGKSVVIIKNGEIDQDAMRRLRLTVLDLVELLRGQDVFDISTVAFAVLEANGELSVLLNNGAKTVTLDDIGKKKEPTGLSLPVITDGKILKESLTALKADCADLEHRLSKENLIPQEVFLMTLDRYGNSCIIKKTDKGAQK